MTSSFKFLAPSTLVALALSAAVLSGCAVHHNPWNPEKAKKLLYVTPPTVDVNAFTDHDPYHQAHTQALKAGKKTVDGRKVKKFSNGFYAVWQDGEKYRDALTFMGPRGPFEMKSPLEIRTLYRPNGDLLGIDVIVGEDSPLRVFKYCVGQSSCKAVGVDGQFAPFVQMVSTNKDRQFIFDPDGNLKHWWDGKTKILPNGQVDRSGKNQVDYFGNTAYLEWDKQ